MTFNTPHFTNRELEFVKLCCTEMTYKEIAAYMGISKRTVDGYREIVFSKLNIKSRQGIMLYAMSNNIIVTKATG